MATFGKNLTDSPCITNHQKPRQIWGKFNSLKVNENLQIHSLVTTIKEGVYANHIYLYTKIVVFKSLCDSAYFVINIKNPYIISQKKNLVLISVF